LYERRVHTHFISEYGNRYVPNPWLIYSVHGDARLRWAQPDALLIDVDTGLIVLVEMKYQHCTEAYWQMLGKYIPLLERIFPENLWKFATVEVVKWYDCSVRFPASITLRKSIDAVRPGEFGVHIWKP
jgi:hypothetical protein